MQVRWTGRLFSSKAEPMSTILALPVRLSMMFDGLRSLCTMPSRCSAASAARHSRITAMATPGLSRGCIGPVGHDHVVQIFPAAVAHPLPRAVEHFAGQQVARS